MGVPIYIHYPYILGTMYRLETMKMITLFMPEAYLERAGDLVKLNRFPNRSEAFRHMIMLYLDNEFGGKINTIKGNENSTTVKNGEEEIPQEEETAEPLEKTEGVKPIGLKR